MAGATTGGAVAAAGTMTGGAGGGPLGGSAGATMGGGSGEAGTGGSAAAPNLFATASGKVEVFVNGEPLGAAASNGELLALAAALEPGAENVIALRATTGMAATPHVQGQLGGAFGKAGTSVRWKAKAAQSADEKTGRNWAASSFDDSGWAAASDAKVAPTAKELSGGPALGVWTSAASDAIALFRLKLYIPEGFSADTPYGYGSAVTGGEGGTIIEVSTAKELAAAVGGNAKKIVRVTGTIDFTGSEGTITRASCYQSQCANGQYEYITNDLGACTSANKL